MLRRIALGFGALYVAALAFVLITGGPLVAQPSGIAQKVAVCDPKFASNCSLGGPFVPDAGLGTSLSVTTASANVALGGTGQAVVVTNTGTVDAFVRVGASTVTATTSDLYVGAGRSVVIARGTATYLAAITASSSTTLQIQTGNGNPVFGGGGSSGAALTNYALETGGNLAAAKADLDTLVAALPNAVPLAAGSQIIGKVGIDQSTPGTTNAVQEIAGSTGGATPLHAIVANNTTSVAIDANPGTLYSVQVFNNNTTIAYLKLYDASQGSTTCGSGTPKKVIMIPANASGAGATIVLGGGKGIAFATAITRCVTTGIADNDTGAPAASTYLIEADYK